MATQLDAPSYPANDKGDALEDLNLTSNEISYGNGIESFMQAVRESPNLTRLNLAGNTLGPEGRRLYCSRRSCTCQDGFPNAK